MEATREPQAQYIDFLGDLPDENTPSITIVDANRILGRLKEAKDFIKQVDEQEADEIIRIKARAQIIRSAHEGEIEFLLERYSAMLEKFTASQIEGKKTRSIDLLNGRIGFRKSPAALEIEDADALLSWAKANLPEAVKTVETVQKTPCKKYVESTGEIPDGAVYSPGVDKFYIN